MKLTTSLLFFLPTIAIASQWTPTEIVQLADTFDANIRSTANKLSEISESHKESAYTFAKIIYQVSDDISDVNLRTTPPTELQTWLNKMLIPVERLLMSEIDILNRLWGLQSRLEYRGGEYTEEQNGVIGYLQDAANEAGEAINKGNVYLQRMSGGFKLPPVPKFPNMSPEAAGQLQDPEGADVYDDLQG